MAKRQQVNDEDTEYHTDPSAPDSAPNHPTPKKQQGIDRDAADLNEYSSQCISDLTPSSRKRPPPNCYREDMTGPGPEEIQKVLSRYCSHALRARLKGTAGKSTREASVTEEGKDQRTTDDSSALNLNRDIPEAVLDAFYPA
ncbi:hypothetical protein LTR92_011262 [Exophiala xenobiotica]|nr:hypothetical protein LTR92_011262 [Exophiala xenobiotica]KAK5432239.1 hypothetical protein LTR18_011248 [Exophiala xenobiotica]